MAVHVNLTLIQNVDCHGNNTGEFSAQGAGSLAGTVYFFAMSFNGGAFSSFISGYNDDTILYEDLVAGTYSVKTKDVKDIESDVKDIIITEPDELIISEILASHQDDSGISDGQFEVESVGGTSPYLYTVDGVTQSSGLFTGLVHDTYSVLVTDDNSCIDSIGITILLEGTLAISEDLNYHIDVDCYDNYTGELGVIGSGGTATMSYYYELYLDDTFLIGESELLGITLSFTDLGAGTYSVFAVDDLGASASSTIIITEPDELEITLVETIDILCSGSSTGTIEVSGSGGTAPYRYTLNGRSNVRGDGIFTNLEAGTYLMGVYDENDCVSTITVDLQQPDEFVIREIEESHLDVDCGGNDGQFEVLANGGTPPYIFSSNGVTQSGGIFTELFAGVYIVTVTDSNDCELTLNITIDPSQKLLDNGIHIYINKKWKNVLINININDNTLPNIRNVDRDELYREMYSKISAQNFISAINDITNKYDFANYVKYIIIDEDGSISEYTYDDDIVNLPYILSCETPDKLLVKTNSLNKKVVETPNMDIKNKLKNGKINSISELNWYNNLPLAYSIENNREEPKILKNYNSNKNIRYYQMFRFSGYYMPVFYDVELFNKDSEDKDYGNYLFDTTLTEFGIIKERKIRKVNRKGSILKMKNSKSDKSIYPMIDEFGYTFTDFMIFKSTFDNKYHLETVKNKIRNIINTTDSSINEEFGQPNDYKNKNKKLL